MAREQADRLKDRPEETWAEILRRLTRRGRPVPRHVRAGTGRPGEQRGNRRRAGGPAGHHAPAVPAHARGRGVVRDVFAAIGGGAGRGTAQRLNRNMIVFLAADARRYEELDEAVRQYLAWKDLRDRGADHRT